MFKKIFILSGEPLSTNHIYKPCNKGIVMTREGKDMKEDYQWQIKSQYVGGKPVPGNATVTIRLHFATRRVKDIDNYNKLILDSFTGLVWEDDGQIQELTISKHFTTIGPRAEVIVKID